MQHHLGKLRNADKDLPGTILGDNYITLFGYPIYPK